MTADRKKVGFVVHYKSLGGGPDAFLAINGVETASPAFSLRTASIFYVDSEARKWLGRMPKVGDGYRAGEVRDVHEQTQLVLGGESMEDLNALLRDIRASNDAARRNVADARGVAVADGDVRGFVETLPISG